MNIRYLKVFLAIVDNQTMNAAARALNVAQPTISQAIAEMENYYGVKLFDRLSKRLYLTPTGEQLLSYARYVVSTFDEMEIFLKTSSQNPLLRIGSTAVFSTCYLSGIARSMQDRHPHISFNITVTNTPTVGTKLLSSELDLGITEGELHHPDLVTEHLTTDQLVLVCGRSHPFYGKTIHLADLNGQNFISREGTSYLRNRFDQLAKEHGITYQETWKCSGGEAIMAAAIDGHGIVVMSSSMIKQQLLENTLYVIPVVDMPEFTREISFVYHKNKYIYPALELFMKTCREYIADCIEDQGAGYSYLLP